MTEARWDSHEELIGALRGIVEKHSRPDPSTLAKLPKPTKKDNEKGKCDVCGGWHGLPAIHIDYMGHAEVTLALIDADPLWEMAFVSDEFGLPVITKEANRLVMWGTLTVCSVTRPCVGTCDSTKPEPEKELIGDMLRNGAMRFGIGTKLWSKATDADAAGSGGAGGYDNPRPRRGQTAPPPKTAGQLVFDRLTGRSPETQAALRARKADFKDAKLTAASFDADPDWLDAVVEILDKATA